MYKLPNILLLGCMVAALGVGTAYASDSKYGLGSTASDAEISGWDIDIRPDGLGLPVGSGNALDGEAEYEMLCASCHGVFGEGEGRWPVLAGGEGTLTDERPLKTVGSYWPYTSTLFDYIRRAMPFTAPLSLTDKQVYNITAYVLYLNEIIDEDFELSNENLASIRLPNEPNFFVDDRPDVQNPRCMADCADPNKLMLAASLSGVTPIGHFVEGADAPAGSHEAQHELEKQKEAARLASLSGASAPAKQVKAQQQLSARALAGEAIYQAACAACHGMGIAGAPKVGDASQWSERMQRGVNAMINNAILGFMGDTGVMPAKGGRVDLSDEVVGDAVYYMMEKSQ